MTIPANGNVVLTSSGAVSMSGYLGTIASAGAANGNLTITTSAGNGNVTLNTPTGVGSVHYGLANFTVNAGTGTISLGTFNGQNWNVVAMTLNGGNINSTANLNFSGALTANVSGTNSTFSGALSGSGAFVKSGSGLVTFSAGNSYTGGTNVNGGTLAFSGVAPTGGTITTAPGAVTQLAYPASVNNSSAVTYAGAGTVVKTGAGYYEGGSGVQGIINMSAGGLIDVEQGLWWSNSYSNQIPTTNRGSLKVASGATLHRQRRKRFGHLQRLDGFRSD